MDRFLTFTFPTENTNLINQCIRDFEFRGYELLSRTEKQENTVLIFALKIS